MDVTLSFLSGNEPIRHNFEPVITWFAERFDSVDVCIDTKVDIELRIYLLTAVFAQVTFVLPQILARNTW
jgi:hypothetical protein